MMHKISKHKMHKIDAAQTGWEAAIAEAETRKVAALIRAEELDAAISIFRLKLEAGEQCPARLFA